VAGDADAFVAAENQGRHEQEKSRQADRNSHIPNYLHFNLLILFLSTGYLSLDYL